MCFVGSAEIFTGIIAYANHGVQDKFCRQRMKANAPSIHYEENRRFFFERNTFPNRNGKTGRSGLGDERNKIRLIVHLFPLPQSIGSHC